LGGGSRDLYARAEVVFSFGLKTRLSRAAIVNDDSLALGRRWFPLFPRAHAEIDTRLSSPESSSSGGSFSPCDARDHRAPGFFPSLPKHDWHFWIRLISRQGPSRTGIREGFPCNTTQEGGHPPGDRARNAVVFSVPKMEENLPPHDPSFFTIRGLYVPSGLQADIFFSRLTMAMGLSFLPPGSSSRTPLLLERGFGPH